MKKKNDDENNFSFLLSLGDGGMCDIIKTTTAIVTFGDKIVKNNMDSFIFNLLLLLCV